jgi:hypothetical protein
MHNQFNRRSALFPCFGPNESLHFHKITPNKVKPTESGHHPIHAEFRNRTQIAEFLTHRQNPDKYASHAGMGRRTVVLRSMAEDLWSLIKTFALPEQGQM